MTPEDFTNEAKVPPRRRQGWGGSGAGGNVTAWSESSGPYPVSRDPHYTDLGGGNGVISMSGDWDDRMGEKAGAFVGPDSAELAARWSEYLAEWMSNDEAWPGHGGLLRQFALLVTGGGPP